MWRWAFGVVAAMFLASGCTRVVTRWETRPVYQMKRVQTRAATATAPSAHRWDKVKVDSHRIRRTVKEIDGRRTALALVVLGVVALGSLVIYVCGAGACGFQ